MSGGLHSNFNATAASSGYVIGCLVRLEKLCYCGWVAKGGGQPLFPTRYASTTVNVLRESIEMISKILKGKAPITVIGVLVLGIVCSAIYDAIVKPGFSMVSRYLFDIFTFGSQRMKDSTFSNAALDPTPVAGLALVLAMLIGAGMYMFYSQLATERIVYKLFRSFEASANENPDTTRDDGFGVRTKLFLRGMLYVARLLVLIFIIASYVLYSSLNQSIIVWRVFQANLNVIAPYVTQDQLSMLKSDFARVRTEKQYIEVNKRIEAIAKARNVELRNDSL
nr:hypothetical protein [Pseudomonas brassicacearum]